jgi:hypothetical protein
MNQEPKFYPWYVCSMWHDFFVRLGTVWAGRISRAKFCFFDIQKYSKFLVAALGRLSLRQLCSVITSSKLDESHSIHTKEHSVEVGCC